MVQIYSSLANEAKYRGMNLESFAERLVGKAPVKTWVIYGEYTENTSPQRSDHWFSIRDTPPLITASNFAAAMGKSKFCSREKLMNIMLGNEVREFSDAAKRHMERGVAWEPLAMEEFSTRAGLRCWETGIKFSNKHPYLAASEDFETIDNGVLVGGEIKCPMKMPYLLVTREVDLPASKRIYPEHYAQIQGAMMVTGRPWHWYVVKSEIPLEVDTGEGTKYVNFHFERVRRDQEYIAAMEESLLGFVQELSSHMGSKN